MLTKRPPRLVAACSACQAAFPDVTTLFKRLDATAIYTFDRAELAQMGWFGDMKAKLRYTWENNNVTNWHDDLLGRSLH